MSDSQHDPTFHLPPFDDVEDIEGYRPGGYHPVDIGAILSTGGGAEYRIVHKLGAGGFATVWLARALHADSRLVAVKVLKAKAPENELAAVLYLRNFGLDAHPGVISCLDFFVVSGPNGRHQCLVFDFVGPSFRHLAVYRRDVVTAPVFHDAGRQLADAVAHLHEHGVVHGDLSSANVLLEAKDTHSWSDDDIYEYFGEPYTAPVYALWDKRARLHAPRWIVANVCYDTFEAEHFTGNVVIADFGVSHLTTASTGRAPPPPPPPPAPSPPVALLGVKWEYGAPELLFGFAPSPASDVWALACLIFEVVSGRGRLFCNFGLDVRFIMTLVSSTLGAFPAAWLAHENRQVELERLLALESHDQDWWKHKWWSADLPSRPLDRVVAERVTGRSDGVKAALLDILRAALVYEPEKRVSAAQIAGHGLWRLMAQESVVDELPCRSIVY